MVENPYESATEEMLAEIIREAESLLDEQLSAAIAADQRALTFAGLLVAAIGALIGAIASLGGKASWPMTAIATSLAVAATFALWSARPTSWRWRGNDPHRWLPDIARKRNMHDCMAEMAAHYDSAAAANNLAMERAAMAMRASLLLTAVTLAAALGWTWWLVARA